MCVWFQCKLETLVLLNYDSLIGQEELPLNIDLAMNLPFIVFMVWVLTNICDDNISFALTFLWL